jgi:hypothetical protein
MHIEALTKADVIALAAAEGLSVRFELKVAKNSQTGKPMEVAYVDGKELFAKRQSHSSYFRLCNQFTSLAPNDGHGPLPK